MINIPSLKPETLRDIEIDFGTSIASSIWRKVVDNYQWVEKSVPVGFILFFYGEITEADGTPKDPPNPDIWGYCDGSIINDPDSPLNGQALPNLIDLFPKGSDTIGTLGGQSTIDISHSHGGATGATDDTTKPFFTADNGNDRREGSLHTHSMNTKWPTDEPIIPKYFSVQPYMRYK